MVNESFCTNDGMVIGRKDKKKSYTFSIFSACEILILPIDPGRNENTDLIETIKRNSNHGLAKNIRGGDDGCNDQDYDQGVFPALSHKIGGQDANSGEKIHKYRQFEYQAGGKSEGNHRTQVGFERDLVLDEFADGVGAQKIQGHGNDQEIAEQDSNEK